MVRELFPYVFHISVLLFFLLSNSIISAQCAGNDNTITVCEKDSDPTFKNFDLFAQLGGSPTLGGVWSTANPTNSIAITNNNTGIVDLWQINNYGEHVFTYTNPNCNESANITIILGGYPGEDNINGGANTCSDNNSVNLFGFLGSNDTGKIPDFNGIWEEVSGTNGSEFLIDNNFFDAELAGPGVYELTYTVSDIGICATRQSRLILEVYPAANAGIPTDLTICNTEDFSELTNFDLGTLLIDEDENGIWEELNTNQLSDLSDSFINIEEINNTLGYGTYSFEYSVFPTHPVCEIITSQVNIIILDANVDPPQAEETQIFCISDYPDDTLTLMDITVSATGDILFYATDTDTTILPITTELENGEDYYISNTDPANDCGASARIRVEIILSDPTTPTSTALSPVICETENPTLANLQATIDSPNSVVWFTSAVGGEPLDLSTLLVNGQSYFAASLTPQQCLSTSRLEFTPIITNAPPPTVSVSRLDLCGLDNPTVAVLFDIKDNSVFGTNWYDQEEGGNLLPANLLLVDGTTYYAENVDPNTNCTSLERISVTVYLDDCEPESYNFFIPDGFSPNTDGKNDTFFIPNIDVIYPNFTLEIFNRYGKSVFKGNINNPHWDGRNGNKIAPNGVYFYIINYNKDNLKPKQGRLYLNR